VCWLLCQIRTIGFNQFNQGNLIDINACLEIDDAIFKLTAIFSPMILLENVEFSVYELSSFFIPQLSLVKGTRKQNSSQLVFLLSVLVINNNQKLLRILVFFYWAIDDCVILHKIMTGCKSLWFHIYVSQLFYFSGKVKAHLFFTIFEAFVDFV
jgi:hypothetical protein